ncbi:MAG: septum formation initiator family protein [Rubrivivax sp.]|jgi:cell division protein FtsB|nr:septum formation initiator family protein [Rubrivivax sp.]
MRLVTVVLSLLIGLVWYDLAFGKGNLFEVKALQQKLDAQLAANQQALARNAQVQAELADLRDGLELVEEKARSELGLVKPDELLVVYGRRR